MKLRVGGTEDRLNDLPVLYSVARSVEVALWLKLRWIHYYAYNLAVYLQIPHSGGIDCLRQRWVVDTHSARPDANIFSILLVERTLRGDLCPAVVIPKSPAISELGQEWSRNFLQWRS